LLLCIKANLAGQQTTWTGIESATTWNRRRCSCCCWEYCSCCG